MGVMARRLITTAFLALMASCGGMPIPGETVEQFFTRCMASMGYEVFDVDAGSGIDSCCGFGTRDPAAAGPAFDQAMLQCQQEAYDRF